MIVTFFNASGIDFGNFLNAHLTSKTVSSNHLISAIPKAFLVYPMRSADIPSVGLMGMIY